jgi:hypothetical protein
MQKIQWYKNYVSKVPPYKSTFTLKFKWFKNVFNLAGD